MKAFGLWMLLLVLPGAVSATPLLSAGAGLLVEQEGRQRNTETRVPFLIRAEYGWPQFDLGIEYATFAASEGEGAFDVQRRQQSFIGLARWKMNSEGGRVRPFVATGAGFIMESTQTELETQVVRNDGRPRLAWVAALGAIAILEPRFEFSLDVRMTMSDDLAPNPMVGATAAIGYRF